MRRGVIAGAAAAVVVVILLWYFFVFAPINKDIDDAQTKADTARRTNLDLQAQLARLRELDRNRPQQEALLRKLDAAIPSTPDLGGFILQANQIASESGIDWLSISPTPPAASTTGGPTVISLRIQVQGGFFQVLDYLNRLEDLDRLVVVDTLAVTAGSSGAAGAAGTAGATAQPATSSGGSPTLSASLGGRMFTRAAAATTPGAAGGGAAATTTTTAARP